ncbi:MAG: hypothetical protein KGL39_44590 [Patescibacteria group bacterium]|nr:hypothetical protein [Patescibacteria group bacterium]
MARFCSKPVTVEATQWFKNGDHPLDYAASAISFEGGGSTKFSSSYRKNHHWEGAIVRYYRNPMDNEKRSCEYCGHVMHDHGWIDTLGDGHIVCPGDWIITGVSGEHYPCKHDIFVATYQAE